MIARVDTSNPYAIDRIRPMAGLDYGFACSVAKLFAGWVANFSHIRPAVYANGEFSGQLLDCRPGEDIGDGQANAADGNLTKDVQ